MNTLKVSALVLVTSTIMWASPMNFSEVDSNKDGKVTKSELAIKQNEMMKKRMSEKRQNSWKNKGQQGQRMQQNKNQ